MSGFPSCKAQQGGVGSPDYNPNPMGACYPLRMVAGGSWNAKYLREGKEPPGKKMELREAEHGAAMQAGRIQSPMSFWVVHLNTGFRFVTRVIWVLAPLPAIPIPFLKRQGSDVDGLR